MRPIMERLLRWVNELRAASRAPRVGLVLLLIALAVTGLTLGLALRSPRVALRASAGDGLGRRHEILQVLATFASERGIDLDLVTTTGSSASLAMVGDRRLDVALVQGGLPALPEVREVAPLELEPLHLLVRDDAIATVEDLRGRRVHLSPPGSGTRELSLALLNLTRVHPERDFREVSMTYEELESLPSEVLPDALFHVSSLPSPVAEFLVRHRGYHFVELPFAQAMHMRDTTVQAGVIPIYAYGGSPPQPPRDVETLATRMLIVAHHDTDADAVRRLLEIVGSHDFARAARLPGVSVEALGSPELPLHDGAIAWQRRNDPLFTPEIIDNIESMRSFIVSAIVALVLFWRWFRARQQRGFDEYLARVTSLEREVLELELAADLDLPRLLQIQRQLGEIKNQALASYGAGVLRSADLLNSFLAHVNDVRTYLNALVLHERERLEKIARRDPDHEDEVRRELWRDAVGDMDGGHDA